MDKVDVYKTVYLLNRYKTSLINKKNKVEICQECNNDLSLENIDNELLTLNDHIYNICQHEWRGEFIEIKNEMHPITLCKNCHLKKRN